ncbi:MAG: ASKHA domain-containing protein [Chloroflexi bacterium]|nr:ASKHA domain-containing protein [Chloroflexota bacterium]
MGSEHDSESTHESTHRVVFQPSGRQGDVPAGTSLLDAARMLGVDVDSICGGRQTCGKCKLLIEDGAFAKLGITSAAEHLTPPGVDELDYARRHASKWRADARLSCAACITGDVLVTVPPESTRRKPIVGKGARDMHIDIDPMLRQVYVEVQAHALGERDGDWERLQQALAREWHLGGLSIDLTVLRTLTATLKAGKQRVTVTVWNECEVVDVRPGYHEGAFGFAVDVGSTTVAAHLCNLQTGEVVGTASMMNPQVTYGEDLMSRISYAMMRPDGVDKMHRAIIDGLNSLFTQAAQQAGVVRDEIYEVVLVGNTVMHHLLLGIDPVELGAAPFTLTTHAPLDIKARDFGLNLQPAANIHLLALEAGHVGADNLAVLIAEVPETRDEMSLIIDVGTNAEIVLGNRNGLWSCSSPTGPAFEGAQIAHGQRAAIGAIERVRIDRVSGMPRFRVIGREAWSDEPAPTPIQATGICGSGIIEAVAELYLAGLLQTDGRFRQPIDGEAPHPRMRYQGSKGEYVLATAEQSATGRDIVVTQDDVRNIQLAKAALYAGCKLLMKHSGVAAVDRIVLAGAFGSYIDPAHAMVLGLIPDCDLSKVEAVGNAAGDGARIALLNRTRRAESAGLARRVNYIETAIDPSFQDEFVGAMYLPHMTDTFPNLETRVTLPARAAAGTRRERRSARRTELNS